MPVEQFTDEDLVAYLDGALTDAEARAIDAALVNDPALVKRLKALDVNLGDLHDAFAQLQPDGGVPDLDMLQMQASASNMNRSPKLLYTLGLAATLVLGAFVGNFWMSPTQEDWTDSVAAYQALYSRNTLANLDLSVPEQELQLTRVSQAIDKKLTVAALSVVDDLQYRRAQLLRFNDAPLVQLSFTTEAGTPIALCIIEAPGITTASAPVTSEAEGMHAARWATEGYEYYLIGGQDAQLISQLATLYATAEI